MNDTAFEGKVLDAAAMRAERDRLHAEGRTLVFTNGCFDILHAGHVTYLQFARAQGDALCIGLNSDASVRRNKGPTRPIVSEDNRAKLLSCLRFVDYVVLFDEDEPKDLIAKILPDVLVKGKDWAHYVSGRDVVEANGGRVVLADLVPGLSTTNIVRRILETSGAAEMRAERDRLHAAGKTLVFTNGCFDILHAGHVTYLQFARAQGDALCLGLNSDASVRRNKGPKRPIVSEDNRAKLLACLRFVDYVVLFDEDEPKDLIAKILPDVLVKGKDWAHYVSGRDVVEANGGRVVLADMVPGLSTTNVIERILAAYREP